MQYRVIAARVLTARVCSRRLALGTEAGLTTGLRRHVQQLKGEPDLGYKADESTHEQQHLSNEGQRYRDGDVKVGQA